MQRRTALFLCRRDKLRSRTAGRIRADHDTVAVFTIRSFCAASGFRLHRIVNAYLSIIRKRRGGNKLEVKVFDNDVEKALKILKNKLSKSGLFKELKLRRAYEKPSVKKKRKTIEARRRMAKVQRRKSA